MSKCIALIGCTLVLACNAANCQAEDDAKGADFFEQQVLPILEQHCFDCHGGGKKIRGEFVLTNRDDLIAGGESGEVIDAKNPDASLLLEAIRYDSLEMPPEGKLSEEQIRTLEKWVKAGVPWNGDGFKPESEAKGMAPPVNDETRSWWAYQPVRKPELPEAKDGKWVRNGIDAFILARLETAGLSPAEPASKQTLIRRAYYDLIGLPPTPQQVAAFVNNDAPDAYEQLIDELLASPQYGEKWARHWLDIVRYAETNSYERDDIKPFVWKYRDYVIRSFNENKPYDQFTLEQLAGDEIADVTADSTIATGYYRLGKWDDEPVDAEQAWFDDMDDVLSTTAQAFMGMTIGCARCHDHKIDPMPQTDYYRMLAFFRNVRRYGVRAHETVLAASVRDVGSELDKQKHAELVVKHQQEVTRNQEALEKFEEKLKPDFSDVEHEEFEYEKNRLRLAQQRIDRIITQAEFHEYKHLTAKRNRLRSTPPRAIAQALCVKERGPRAPDTYVTIRGNASAKGEQVSPGFPTVLSPPEPEIKTPDHNASTGRRLALAKWLVSPANPLTSRVIVNRIWQHHFGRGIVRSPNDFGFQGNQPTHPELLDWLADRFVAAGWQFKSMHRLIMLSNTYRMASQTDAKTIQRDPANDLFSRFNLRRLTAEEVRDSILAVNGKLNLKMHGPSVFPPLPREVLEGQSEPGKNWNTSTGDEVNRRSIYLHSKRSLPIPIMQNFDVADTGSSCPVRFNTTQPAQALTMFNSGQINREAAQFAKRLRQKFPKDVEQQVTHGLGLVLQRQPLSVEIEDGVSLIEKLTIEDSVSDERSLEYFCLVCLNMNEFIYLD